MNDCFLMALALKGIKSKCPGRQVDGQARQGSKAGVGPCTLLLIVGKPAVGRLLFTQRQIGAAAEGVHCVENIKIYQHFGKM